MTMSLTVLVCCCIVLRRTWIRLARIPIPKRIFHNSPDSGKPVVEDVLRPHHIPEAVRLHHVGWDSEGIVNDKEVWHILVVFGKKVKIRRA